MTAISWSLILLAAALSAANTLAVWRSLTWLEYISKPGVMLVLIAAAVSLRPHDQAERDLFIIALMLGLASDVFLMLPRDLFIQGLFAALVEHIAYIAGFRFGDFSGIGAAIGVVIVVLAAWLLLPRLWAALGRSGHASLRGPVAAYVVVISLMTVSAAASGSAVASAGGLLFFASDALLAWYRFVGPLRWGRPVNIATYQLGQGLLVLSLAL